MAKRDYVAEISARRARMRKHAPRYHLAWQRLDALIGIAGFIRDSKAKDLPYRSELVKYLPIGFVACMEGYFRLVYRDLVDHGRPYRNNVVSLKDIRLGIDHVLAMQDGKLTLGEFVSHLLPTNGLKDIDDSMSALLGESFLDRIKTVKADYFDDTFVSLEEEGMTGPVFRDVQAIFDQRHIFAHELATKVRVNARQLSIMTAAVTIFMYGTETLVSALLNDAA